MRYQLFKPIIVRYLAIDKLSGLSDLQVTITSPDNIDTIIGNCIEIENGLYQTIFTPDQIGNWWLRISSVSRPKNIYSKSYYVTNELTDNMIGEAHTYIAKVILNQVGSNKIHCNIFNNLGSGIAIKIWKLVINQNMNGTLTGHNISLKILKSTTKGIGIDLIINKINKNAPDIINQITMTNAFTTNPILSTNDIIASANLDMEETRSGLKQVLYQAGNGLSPIILYENEGLALQQDALASNGYINIFYYFTIW